MSRTKTRPRRTSASPAEPARETPAAPPRRRLTSGAAIALVTAVVALVSSGIALAFQIWPDWKPNPRDRVSGAVTVEKIETDVTLADFTSRDGPPAQLLPRLWDKVRRTGVDPKGDGVELVQDRLALRGTLFYVRATLEGFKGAEVEVRGRLYDAATGHPVANHPGAQTSRYSIAGDTPSDNLVVLAWTPSNNTEGKLFARFTLVIPDKGLILAVADSEPFQE